MICLLNKKLNKDLSREYILKQMGEFSKSKQKINSNIGEINSNPPTPPLKGGRGCDGDVFMFIISLINNLCFYPLPIR